MNPNLTEIVFIVDRSGSMSSLRTDAINGFNSFVNDQSSIAGDARLTLVLFNHEYFKAFDAEPLRDCSPLSVALYVPTGKTALLDAVGRSIDELGEKLAATPEHERPSRVIVAILTDGLENSSKRYTKTQVAEKIKHQQERYSWQFLFMGANQDALAEGRALNIPPYHAATFSATGAGTRAAFGRLSRCTSIIRGDAGKRSESPGLLQARL